MRSCALLKAASINLHYAKNIPTKKQQVNIPFISLMRKSQAYIRPRRLFTEDFALSPSFTVLPDRPSFLHRRSEASYFLISSTGTVGKGKFTSYSSVPFLFPVLIIFRVSSVHLSISSLISAPPSPSSQPCYGLYGVASPLSANLCSAP